MPRKQCVADGRDQPGYDYRRDDTPGRPESCLSVHLSHYWFVFICVYSWSRCSVSSETSRSGIETLYSSLAHLPRSMTRQRSEQNGRSGLSFHFVGSPQIGHFIFQILYGLTLNF